MTEPMTSQEYAEWVDPEMNKYWGLKDMVAICQNDRLTEYLPAIPLVVHKKVYDKLRQRWNWNVFTDDTGLPAHQRRITKISWI